MTDHYAVVGNPIAQSKSPLIHAAFAEATGQDLEYRALLAPLDGFRATADEFRQQGGRGLNITAPFKLDAAAYATTLHERARLAGAVNCLRIEGDQVEAENYDGIGLRRDVEANLGLELRGRRVLLLGAGGATRGLLQPFLEAGPAELVVANRTFAKAEALCEAFSGHGSVIAARLDEFSRATPFDLVLNATSASLRGELPAISPGVFGPKTLAYELAYGKGLTPFLRLARETGTTRLHDGIGMLVEQAAEAFLWWRGIRPQTGALIERFTIPLT